MLIMGRKYNYLASLTQMFSTMSHGNMQMQQQKMAPFPETDHNFILKLMIYE